MEEEIEGKTFGLTEMSASPQAFLRFGQISPLVKSSKAIPVGQKGGGGEDKLRE